MWGLLIFLVIGAAVDRSKADDAILAPEYVQSRANFEHTRLYLQQSLPHDDRDMTNPEARKHLAFGIMSAIAGVLSVNYTVSPPTRNEMLLVMHRAVPLAWENYNYLADKANGLLAEANTKIRPIVSIIDELCNPVVSVSSCNELVQQRVSNSNNFIQNRAKLLIELGTLSKLITSLEGELNAMTSKFTVVSYMLKHIESEYPLRDVLRSLSQIRDLLPRLSS